METCRASEIKKTIAECADSEKAPQADFDAPSNNIQRSCSLKNRNADSIQPRALSRLAIASTTRPCHSALASSSLTESLGFFIMKNANSGTTVMSKALARWRFPYSIQIVRCRRYNLQFRREFFNAANRVKFGVAGMSFGTSNFCVISSQSNIPRQIQLALKFLF